MVIHDCFLCDRVHDSVAVFFDICTVSQGFLEGLEFVGDRVEWGVGEAQACNVVEGLLRDGSGRRG